MRPELYVELHLVFDNDYDVMNITKLTGFRPYKAKKRKDNRISPITNKHIEGYWEIRSEKFTGEDTELAYNDIINKVGSKIDVLREICEQNDGQGIIFLVATFEHNESPYLEITSDFIRFANELNASVRIITYIDDEEYDCEDHIDMG